MTLVDPDYFIEIVGKLRSEGREVRHFTLFASPETLLDGLKSRGEGRDSWAALQMQRCLKGLKNKVFEHHVDTEYKSISQVAEIIIIAMIETQD